MKNDDPEEIVFIPKEPILLAIVGWRSFTDYKHFSVEVNKWIQENGTPAKILSGGCVGTDRMAEKYAKEHSILMDVRKEDRKKYPMGNRCYAMRDKEIAETCTHMLAFPSCLGKGTQLTIGFAKSVNKHLTVIPI